VAAVAWITGALVVTAALHHGDPRDFIFIGMRFIGASHTSPSITIDPSYGGYGRGTGQDGYDGQFFYYMGLDPTGAVPYVDAPAYRYGRILYPMLARALSLGMPALLPWALILINLAAMGAGTLGVAMWLRRRDVSPWFALLYGLYPGMVVVLRYDLSEALAYALTAFGVLAFGSCAGRWRVLGGAALFGLAALARESTAVFPVVLALSLLWRGPDGSRTASLARNAPLAAAVLAVAVGPFLVWKAFLRLALHGFGPPLGQFFEPLPFLGIAHFAAQGLTGAQAQVLESVVVPGTIVAALIGYRFIRHSPFTMGWLFLANYVPFVVFLSRYSYVDLVAGSRVTLGVTLAALLCLPELLAWRPSRGWVGAAAALWVAPSAGLVLVPVVPLVAAALRHLIHLL
jgi:hypothetical protein